MFFLKYGLFALTLVTWFASSSSVDFDLDDEMQGDREKRTLILGVLFKKLLLQQALARNNMRMNSTTMMMMPAQGMMGDSGNPPQGPQQVPEQPAPAPPPAPAQPPSTPQPAQNSPPPPQPTSQAPPPALSMPQGIRTPPAVSQGPSPTQGGFPQQLPLPGPQGFPSFNPSQQQLLFPANYPFGVQGFRQLPFGPAPPLGAQAGPQSGPAGTRFNNFFPFNFPNGYFQNIPQQQNSFLPPTGTLASPSQAQAPQAGPQNLQFAPQQQAPSQQQQIPPSSDGSSQQVPPLATGPSGPGGPSEESQTSPSAQESGPNQSGAGPSGPTAPSGPGAPSGPTAPSGPGGENPQGLQPDSPSGPDAPPPTNPTEPQPPQLPTGDGPQQNFQFGPGPSGLPPRADGSLPNFSFDPQQGSASSNGQEAPPGQQGQSTNFQPQQLDANLQQQFDSQLQQQLSTNGLTSANPSSQNFASPNGSPAQPGQPDNGFFDLRQFAGADNSVFDFPQEAGNPENGNPDQQQQQEQQQQQQQQQQTQPQSFQNGLFSPSQQEQFSSANDPRSNFAFRGQQFDFSSPFQDSGNFQRNFFQQNLF